MEEIASLSIHTITVPEESKTLFGFVPGVMVQILPELSCPVSELAFIVVRAKSRTQVIPAQLIFELVVLGSGELRNQL